MISNLKKNKCGGHPNPAVRANLGLISASITRLTQNTRFPLRSLSLTSIPHQLATCMHSMLPVSFNSLMWLTFQGLAAGISCHSNYWSYDGYSPCELFYFFSLFFHHPPPPLKYLLVFCTTAVKDPLKYSKSSLHLARQLISAMLFLLVVHCYWCVTRLINTEFITPLNYATEDTVSPASCHSRKCGAALLT